MANEDAESKILLRLQAADRDPQGLLRRMALAMALDPYPGTPAAQRYPRFLPRPGRRLAVTRPAPRPGPGEVPGASAPEES